VKEAEIMSQAIDRLRTDEGNNPKAHLVDKKLHIGIGYLLEGNNDASSDLIKAGVPPEDVKAVMKLNGKALTPDQTEALFDIALQKANRRARSVFPNYPELPATLQGVLVNMSYQHGSLADWPDLRKAVADKDYKAASAAIKDSQTFRKQTPARLGRHAKAVASLHREAPVVETSKQQVMTKAEKQESDWIDSMSDDLASTFSEEQLVNDIADVFTKEAMKAEEEDKVAQEEQKPKQKVEKLEAGLFQNEAGGLFEVDSNSKIHSLDADGQRQESTNG
jgi:hypothetical protein